MSNFLESIKDYVRQHPYAVLTTVQSIAVAYTVVMVASEGQPIKWLKKKVFQAVLSAVPSSVVNSEQAKIRKDIAKQVIGHSLEGEEVFAEMPVEGMKKDEIITLLDKYSKKDEKNWTGGKVSGTVYHGGKEVVEIMNEAFSRFTLSNPLHPDVFPLLRKMESECVSMTLKLFHGGENACGTMTSGGTESILMAVKAYRDYARKTRNVTEPELIVPVTAHAAFDKGCDYFGIKLRHIPVDPVTFRVDPALMEKAINENTIGLVGSAPNYPQGVIDPIEELGAIAVKYNIPLHVDCCLGSYCIAFATRAGFEKKPFDFRVPGVTSISCDTHKYGFASKGSSIVMYSSEELRYSQYFVAPDWTGGVYASPAVAGSRPGSIIACCWAALMFIGQNGYTEAAKKILSTTKEVASQVNSIDDIQLYGEPDLSVICFGLRPESKLSIYAIGDEMTARGWNLNTLQNPACIHICVTYANADTVRSSFINDLKESVAVVKATPAEKYSKGSAAIYGLAASIPDKSVVAQVAYGFLDALYKTSI